MLLLSHAMQQRVNKVSIQSLRSAENYFYGLDYSGFFNRQSKK